MNAFEGTAACTIVHTSARDGARLAACPHGGQILEWSPAGDGRDRLWLSPLARCGPGEAIRGGIPVVFPQFAGRGPLPKHGLARDRPWELEVTADGAVVARVTARLRDDRETYAVWPHRFTLTLVAEASGNDLTLRLGVRNDAPPQGEPFTLTAALHAYLAADVSSVRLFGLSGTTAEDNAADGRPRRLPDGPLEVTGPLDVAVRGARGPVRLAYPAPDPATQAQRGGELEISCPSPDGFDALVVWNPGLTAPPADVPADGAARFVCVEPARLTPLTLAPRETWTAVARFTALVPIP